MPSCLHTPEESRAAPGMVVSNLAGMPNSRPGTANVAAPSIDVLSQEVEEMEQHGQHKRENEAQVRDPPPTADAPPR